DLCGCRYAGATGPGAAAMSDETAALRRQFPLLAQAGGTLHYLDNAATGQIHEAALDAMVQHERYARGNVLRAGHRLAQTATPADQRARRQVPSGRRALVGRRCRLIALTHASNVTGAVTDVGPVVEQARAVGAHVLLDGAQRAPHGPVDVRALGVDFYVFSGHKSYGPGGVGVLWGRGELLDAMPPSAT